MDGLMLRLLWHVHSLVCLSADSDTSAGGWITLGSGWAGSGKRDCAYGSVDRMNTGCLVGSSSLLRLVLVPLLSSKIIGDVSLFYELLRSSSCDANASQTSWI